MATNNLNLCFRRPGKQIFQRSRKSCFISTSVFPMPPCRKCNVNTNLPVYRSAANLAKYSQIFRPMSKMFNFPPGCLLVQKRFHCHQRGGSGV